MGRIVAARSLFSDLAIKKAIEESDGLALAEDEISRIVLLLDSMRHQPHKAAVRDAPTLSIAIRRPRHPITADRALPKALEDALQVSHADVTLALAVKDAEGALQHLALEHRSSHRIVPSQSAGNLPLAGRRGTWRRLPSPRLARMLCRLLLHKHGKARGS